MAMLVLLLCPEGVDREKALVMAVLHDLAELRTGDITPQDGVSPEEKHRREAEAMRAILPDRPDLVEVWEAYEAGETPEARFVHACDKLDMGLQARHVSEREGVDLEEFMEAARNGGTTFGDRFLG